MSDEGDSRPRRRPGGRSARVRAAVLGATLDELAAAGYANLGFEEIARRAGVHKTTIYRNWGSREELVREALLARSEVTVPIPDTGSLREDLIEFAKAIVANITAPAYEAIVRAVASEARTEGALGQAAQEFWQERLRLLRVIVLRGIDRGELPATVDSNVLLETLLGPLYLRLLITREPLDEAFLELVVDQLVGRPSTAEQIDESKRRNPWTS
jgi:AcrR family transcriptional regulator